MNLGDARIRLRPRTLAESLDLGLLWCMQVGRGTYLRLLAIVLLPAAVGCWLLHVIVQWTWPSVWIVAISLFTLLQAPFTVAASELMFEREVTARRVLLRCLRRTPAILAAWVASWLWIGLGIALLFVGAAWTWPQVEFVREAVLLEGMGPLAAMQRARKFVRYEHGHAFSLLLVQGAIASAFVLFAEQIDEMALGFMLQLGRPLGAFFEEGGSLFTLLGLFAAAPYMATVRFLRYVDIRTRRDGWDLQVAFLALVVADEEARRQEVQP